MNIDLKYLYFAYLLHLVIRIIDVIIIILLLEFIKETKSERMALYCDCSNKQRRLVLLMIINKCFENQLFRVKMK